MLMRQSSQMLDVHKIQGRIGWCFDISERGLRVIRKSLLPGLGQHSVYPDNFDPQSGRHFFPKLIGITVQHSLGNHCIPGANVS